MEHPTERMQWNLRSYRTSGGTMSIITITITTIVTIIAFLR